MSSLAHAREAMDVDRLADIGIPILAHGAKILDTDGEFHSLTSA